MTPMTTLPVEAREDEAIAEWREIHGERNVFEPICKLHCIHCDDGSDHHWMPDCDPSGEPVMVCKHCPAVRDLSDEDVEL